MTTITVSNDQQILELLRNEGPQSIEQMVAKVGVTATAIRHRLNRMMGSGLVERFEVKQGRGRPSHQYRLSKKGVLAAGNNLADLATAVWDEVQSIPDEALRRSILQGVVERLADAYGDQIDGATPAERMASVAALFGKKNVPFVTEEKDGSTILKIVGCPYPELANENKELCEMEKELLSKLTETQLSISKNACDCSDNCCTFEVVAEEQQ